MPKIFKNFINGLVFGITQVIPGVSVGTIALILGFYFDLIESINNFFKDIRKSLKFLLPLAIGIVIGMLLFSSIIDFLLTSYSFPTMMFFIGLIAGIIPRVYSMVKGDRKKLDIKDFLFIVIPFIILSGTTFLNTGGSAPREVSEVFSNISFPYMVFLFIAGILAASALVVPGFSGSVVLLLLGVYHLAIYSISSIRFLLLDLSNITLMINIIKVIIPLGIGTIIGIVFMANIIERMFKNHRREVFLVVLGLLLGSVFNLFGQPILYASGITPVILVIGVATFLSGCLVSFKLGKDRL
ncbi:MAG: DUF368 domain-containing protein [Treponema sp.]|nr:DUF368 domain-containing protein [Treponema sp.]